jgi:hypothetical protein
MFKVGDIVTGTPESIQEYGITNADAIMEVISLSPRLHTMQVKILSSVNDRIAKYYIGQVFGVVAKYFTLYSGDAHLQQTAVERKIAVMYKRFENRNAK